MQYPSKHSGRRSGVAAREREDSLVDWVVITSRWCRRQPWMRSRPEELISFANPSLVSQR